MPAPLVCVSCEEGIAGEVEERDCRCEKGIVGNGKWRAVPLARNLRQIARRHPTAQGRIDAVIQRTDSTPLPHQLFARLPQRLCLQGWRLLHIPVVRVSQAEIELQRPQDSGAQAPDVGDGEVCALGDVEGVEGEEVGGGDAVLLEGGEEADVGGCGEGGEDGGEVCHGGVEVWRC